MKKLFVFSLFLVSFLIAAPFAVADENSVSTSDELEVQLPAKVIAKCDPAANWGNHGAFVSCVAKLHPGGDVVSLAAKSNVGKHNDELTPIESVTPEASPSAEASISASLEDSGHHRNFVKDWDNFWTTVWIKITFFFHH